MELDFKKIKKIKADKLITIILIGVFILVAVTPVKNSSKKTGTVGKAETYNDSYAKYYEDKLDTMLEETYGPGTIRVMVHVSDERESDMFYASESKQTVIDGVLVVTTVKSEQVKADITYAVGALFGLPAHKVAVMIEK